MSDYKFLYPCYVINTPGIIEHLEKIGYKRNCYDHLLNSKYIYAYQYPIEGFDSPNWTIADSLDLMCCSGSALNDKFIDCGNNKELFLAISALRSDSDYMQWFVCEFTGDWYLHEQKCRHIDCYYYVEGEDDNLTDTVMGEKYPHYPYHKATLEELKKQFKNE